MTRRISDPSLCGQVVCTDANARLAAQGWDTVQEAYALKPLPFFGSARLLATRRTRHWRQPGGAIFDRSQRATISNVRADVSASVFWPSTSSDTRAPTALYLQQLRPTGAFLATGKRLPAKSRLFQGSRQWPDPAGRTCRINTPGKMEAQKRPFRTSALPCADIRRRRNWRVWTNRQRSFKFPGLP